MSVRGARSAEPAQAAGTLVENEDRDSRGEMRQAALDSSGADAARAGDLPAAPARTIARAARAVMLLSSIAVGLPTYKEATSGAGAEILLSTRRPLPATREHAFLSLASRINCSARNASSVSGVPHPWGRGPAGHAKWSRKSYLRPKSLFPCPQGSMPPTSCPVPSSRPLNTAHLSANPWGPAVSRGSNQGNGLHLRTWRSRITQLRTALRCALRVDSVKAKREKWKHSLGTSR